MRRGQLGRLPAVSSAGQVLSAGLLQVTKHLWPSGFLAIKMKAPYSSVWDEHLFFNHPHFTNESSKSLNNLHCTRMPLRKKKSHLSLSFLLCAKGTITQNKPRSSPHVTYYRFQVNVSVQSSWLLPHEKHLMFYLAAFIVHVNRLVSGLVFEEEKNCVPSC